jgi:phage gpG-like protein
MEINTDWTALWWVRPEELIKQIDDTIPKRMEAAVRTVQAEAITLLSQQGTGRQYKVPGTKNTYYTASSPGQPPAVATGDLKRSIDVDVSDDGLIGEVGTEIDYGMMLQFGTRNILARPWLDVAFNNCIYQIVGIFSQDWMQ